MNKILLTFFLVIILTSSANAQWADLINKAKNNVLVQKDDIQVVISKVQSLVSTFSQMPPNSGKLELINAALPLLTQAKSMSTDVNQTNKVSGLLDQVKDLTAKNWSSDPLTPAQTPEVEAQSRQLSGLLSDILQNEGGALKNLLQSAGAAASH